MATDNILVSGLFNTRSQAESAVLALVGAAFSQADLSILAAGERPGGDFAIERSSKVGSGAAIGAGLGGALGALLVGFTAVGALVTGGAALIAAGPIVAALAGAGVGAATGGLVGGLIGLGVPEDEIKYYAESLEKGSVLLGVRTTKGAEAQVRRILEQNGATRVTVGSLPEGRARTPTAFAPTAGRAGSADDWARDNPLKKLFADQLRDIYYAEHQLVDSLEKLETNSSAPDLARAFSDHRDETRRHITRLETIFDMIGVKPEQRKCPAINGIISEAKELIKLDDTLSQRDAAMICAAQKAEHYEIGTYGCLRTYARTLGLDNAADLLEQTLHEEWNADQRLTDLANAGINERAKIMQTA